jgi:DNA-binding transcriptional MerR regulator/methylmalonyl-CoA mutase cobalamin-binding subunit
MADQPDDLARYPLRAVIRRTGLSADVLRAWERRYGAVHPERSEGGQRLYSDADVERLVMLQRATAAGHSISEIARLDRAALDALLESDSRPRSARALPAVDIAVRDAMLATEHLDPAVLEGVLKRGALAAGTERFVDEAVPRFLQNVGDRWHRGSFTPAHEHLASDTVRRVLGWIAEAYDVSPDAPRLVVATPSSELHELGAMLVAAAAASEGWNVLYLGPNLPAVDIVAAASQVGASAVALSIVYSESESTVRDLRTIASTLPPGVLFLVGGMAAVRLERALADIDLRIVRDLDTMRVLLRDRREARSTIAAD